MEGGTAQIDGDGSATGASTGAVETMLGRATLGDPFGILVEFDVEGVFQGERVVVTGSGLGGAIELTVEPFGVDVSDLRDELGAFDVSVTYPEVGVLTNEHSILYAWDAAPQGYSGGAYFRNGDVDRDMTIFLGSEEPVTYGCVRDDPGYENCRERVAPTYTFDPDSPIGMCSCDDCLVVEGPCDRSDAVGQCIFDEYIEILYPWHCDALIDSSLDSRCGDGPGPELDGEFEELNGGCPR